AEAAPPAAPAARAAAPSAPAPAAPPPADPPRAAAIPAAAPAVASAAPVAAVPSAAPIVTPSAEPAAPVQAPAAGTPPWEDLPATPPSNSPVAAAPKTPTAAALAVTPPAAQAKALPPDADGGPPAWVDEDIPDEAEGGYVPAAEFTADPDDEFETLATEVSAAELAPAPRPQQAPRRARQATARLDKMSAADWPGLAARLPVTGLAAELARQSEWTGVQGDAVVLRVAVKTLAESESRVRLQTVLCEHFGQGLRLEIEVGATGDATAHAVAQIERAARQQAAEDAVAVDPFVQALRADFGGRVVPGSVRAVDPSA
ncbi:DNA polymerase III subunit gamma/tau, partial [Bordetella sp. BOR01]|nr:DNA polymerase III subunit gamma/tau [Bordetella sp. BOR01]